MNDDFQVSDVEELAIGASGGVLLYFHLHTLQQDSRTLISHGYAVAETMPEGWNSLEAFATNFSRVLRPYAGFSETFNLDDIDRALWNLEFPLGSRLALVLRRFERFIHVDSVRANGLLDGISLAARRHLLYGKRLICLAEVRLADHGLSPIGSVKPYWAFADAARSRRQVEKS